MRPVFPRGGTIGAARLPARGSAATPRPRSLPERLLLRLHADPAFAEAVLGDLEEEYALRAAQHGGRAARRWYAREALRSAPHLVRNSVSRRLSYLSARERSLIAAYVAAGILLTSFAIRVALSAHNGPPVRLSGASDAVIVNNSGPVQLPIQALDAAGHVLHVTGVRYQWISGSPVRMSAAGRVTCEQRGDALVRASFGGLRQSFLLRCRPIQRFVNWRESLWLVVGDSAQDLPVHALGVDGTPETVLSGSATVRDSEVASLRGLRVHPNAPGATEVDVWVGGMVNVVPITVFRRASSSNVLRPFELVASPLRLASGQARQWHIQPGKYFVSFRSDTVASAKLTLSTIGATCSRFGDAYNYFCTASRHASVVISAPGGTSETRELSGYLIVRRGS
jgi:hypothetical protein